MANILEFANHINSIGLLDKEITLSSPFRLPQAHKMEMQVQSVQISDRIPNVFNGKPFGVNFNNTIVYIGTDVEPMQPIALEAGLYITADMIAAAINKAITTYLGWWAVSTDPGLIMSTNYIVDKINIEIDSTKLAPVHGTQFILDLRQSTTGCDMRLTLGFTELTAYFNTDGLHSSTQLPVMDQQGTYCQIEASFMPLRKQSTEQHRTLAVVTYAGKTTPSDNTWPAPGQLSPRIVYDGDRDICSYTVTVKTYNGLPMIFLNGVLYFSVAFYG